jgi:hypothetical protein
MSGLYDILFGNLPPPPAHPPSTGALLGMNYQTMPTSPNIDDRRQDAFPYADLMRGAWGESAQYPRSPIGAGDSPGQGYDFMPEAALDISAYAPEDVAPYRPSFKPNWRVRPSGRAPYQSFEIGPNLPPPPFVHLPIAPGDPGWTSPPSPSGPHNREGDPPRPGYDRPSFTLGAASPFSVQQLIDVFRSWPGGRR